MKTTAKKIRLALEYFQSICCSCCFMIWLFQYTSTISCTQVWVDGPGCQLVPFLKGKKQCAFHSLYELLLDTRLSRKSFQGCNDQFNTTQLSNLHLDDEEFIYGKFWMDGLREIWKGFGLVFHDLWLVQLEKSCYKQIGR